MTLRRRLLGILAALAASVSIALVAAPAASAHPLGNFTINYYSGIQVEPHAVVLALVVDRAEIPTLQAFPDAAPGRQPAGVDPWRARQCAQLAAEAVLSAGATRLPLAVTSSRLEILPGAAGLATSRLECTLRTSGAVGLVGTSVTYRAATTSGRVGWHEVTARGNGTTLSGSDVPKESASRELTSYPNDLLTSPLDQRTAQFTVRAGSGLVAQQTASGPLKASPLRGLDTFTTGYTNLVSRASLTPTFALLAILLSVLLGGLHAFAPGHGKTLMAAYLVGREGTWRQAAVIGASVTITHTIGVLLLGVALSAATLAAPERVYPWLGLLSGVLLAGIGVTLLRSARAGHVHGPGGHTHGPGGHTHGPGGHAHRPGGHTHEPASHVHEPAMASHPVSALVGALPAGGGLSDSESLAPSRVEGHDHNHGHGHATTEPRRTRRSTWRLAAVGLAGGLVPSPSALLVLLGGIALGRAWFGAVLVLFYGIGMATALVGTGLLLVLARDRFERWNSRRPAARTHRTQTVALRLTRALPALTAIAVMGVGASIAVRSLISI